MRLAAIIQQKLQHPSSYVGMLIALLALFKWPVLDLPHFWDEAFPYSYAIGYLSEHCPSILPGSVPSDYSTGHPLLYYFFQSFWNVVVGDVLWLQRLLPLSLSCLSVWLTYRIGSRMFSSSVGLGAAILLVAQDAWIAQSSFQLPETSVVLLFLLTLLALLEGKRLLFMIASSLLLLTKEPSVVLLFSLWLIEMVEPMRRRSWKSAIQRTGYYVPALVILASYLTIQYFTFGWVLFPRHTGFIEFNFAFFADQLSRYFEHLMLRQGRNILFFSTLLGTLFLLVRKRTSLTQGFLYLLVPLFLFLIFSAFNFYSNRYILVLFPIWSVLAAAIFERSFNSKGLYFPVVIVLAGICAFEGWKNQRPLDHSHGYAHAVRAQQEMVDFCVDRALTDKSIACGFITSKLLTSPHPGYVEAYETFTQVVGNDIDKADYIFITDHETEMHYLLTHASFELLHRTESGKSWCALYERKI